MPDQPSDNDQTFKRVYAEFHELGPIQGNVETFYNWAQSRLQQDNNDLAGCVALLLLDQHLTSIDLAVFQRVSQRCLSALPTNLEILACIGIRYVLNKSYGLAEKVAHTILDLDKSEPRGYEILIRARHQTGSRDDLISLFEEVKCNARRGIRYQGNTQLTWSMLVRSRGDFTIQRKNRSVLHRKITQFLQSQQQSAQNLMESRAIVWVPYISSTQSACFRGVVISPKCPMSVVFEYRSKAAEETLLIQCDAQLLTSEFCGMTVALGATVSHWEANPNLPNDWVSSEVRMLSFDPEGELTSDFISFDIPRQRLGCADTLASCIIGKTGISMNAQVSSTTPSAQSFFKYGTDPECFDKHTLPEFIPPGINAHACEAMQNEGSRIFNYGYYRDIEASDDSKIPEDTVKLAQIMTSPFGQDPHHLNGPGFVALIFAWTPIIQAKTSVPVEYQSIEKQRGVKGLRVDMRDAIMSIRAQSQHLTETDFHPMCWMTSGSDVYTDFGGMEEFSTPWLKTGDAGSHSFSADGNWQTFEFLLTTDSNQWSFSGNNIEDYGKSWERYTYSPLGECLSDGRGGNLLFCFGLGDPVATPQGEVRVSDVSLRYRSQSMLCAGQGAILTKWPAKSFIDPGVLTDGSRGNLGKMWCSLPNPDIPQTFIWTLRTAQQVHVFQITQNLAFPSRHIKISVAGADCTFNEVWIGDITKDGLNATGTINAKEPGTTAGVKNPVVSLILDEPIEAHRIKLEIFSGYDSSWGMDQFEVFGEGAELIPDGAPVSVCNEATGFEPGSTVYVQSVVVENGLEILGNINSVTLPMSDGPTIDSVKMIAMAETYIDVLVRVNAMGSFGQIWATTEDTEVSNKRREIGRQNTPRHATLRINRALLKQQDKIIIHASNSSGYTQWDFIFSTSERS